MPTTPIVLTIAGSDSCGGAGIQADIKTISALGAYAASVVTAVTAQNTLGVNAIHTISLEVIESQLDAVLSDLDIKAVKIGMLSEPAVIELVVNKLAEYDCLNIVLDPVMVATSGDRLLQASAVSELQSRLLPLATIVTPNLPEAAILAGIAQADFDSAKQNKGSMVEMGEKVLQTGVKNVLIKGGHLQQSDSPDLLLCDQSMLWFDSARIDTQNTHGTGCTLSSAIATYLAKGKSIEDAVKHAKDYIQQAIIGADELEIGSGHGPVNHFWNQ